MKLLICGIKINQNFWWKNTKYEANLSSYLTVKLEIVLTDSYRYIIIL